MLKNVIFSRSIRRAGAVIALAGVLLTGGLLGTPNNAAQAADPTATVIALVNAERAWAGLGPVTYNPNLTYAAQNYANLLSHGSCWGHYCDGYSRVSHRLEAAGYRNWTTVGENIAAGQWSPEAVVAAWMASPGHRANILNPNYTEIGVGLAHGGPYGVYWSQNFGARSSYYLTPTSTWRRR